MTMSETTQGLHHVTAIAGDPQKNVDFYISGLGLRLVKKTVNVDGFALLRPLGKNLHRLWGVLREGLERFLILWGPVRSHPPRSHEVSLSLPGTHSR